VFGSQIVLNIGILVAGAALLVVAPSSASLAVVLIVMALGSFAWLEWVHKMAERMPRRKSEQLLQDVRAVLNSGEHRQ